MEDQRPLVYVKDLMFELIHDNYIGGSGSPNISPYLTFISTFEIKATLSPLIKYAPRCAISIGS